MIGPGSHEQRMSTDVAYKEEVDARAERDAARRELRARVDPDLAQPARTLAELIRDEARTAARRDLGAAATAGDIRAFMVGYLSVQVERAREELDTYRRMLERRIVP